VCVRNFNHKKTNPYQKRQTFGATGASFDGSQLLSKASIDNSARTYFKSLGFNGANIHFKSGYTSGSTRHAYVKQSYVSHDWGEIVTEILI